MFFIRKSKVDEDVENIRAYTMSPEQLQQEMLKKEAERKQHDEAVEGFGFKDVVAMTIAMMSVLLPYVLIVFGTAALVFLYFYLRSGI